MTQRIFIVFISLLTFISCCSVSFSSSSNVSITSVTDSKTTSSVNKMRYQDFWEAMENLDFEFLKSQKVTLEQRNFARVLQLIIQGRYLDAENILKTLLKSSNNTRLSENCRDILQELYLLQSKWDQLVIHPDADEKSKTKYLWEAYSHFPKEIYVFSNSSIPISITFNRGGTPIIPVKVNGKVKKFLIDTGAGLSVMASDVAQDCGVTPYGKKTVLAGTGTSKKVVIRPAMVKELKISGVTIKNHPIIVLNKKDLEIKIFGIFRVLKIEGILGWNAIQNLDLTIDYRNKKTWIKRPREKLKKGSRFFWLSKPIIQLRSLNGRILNFTFDTGANRSSISENLLKKLNVKVHSTGNKMVGSAGGFEKIRSKTISDLSFLYKNQKIYFKKISTDPKLKDTFIKFDGILGNDAFQNKILHLDFKNGVFDII